MNRRAQALVDAVGDELAASPFAHQTQDRQLERIPAPTEEEAGRRTDLARQWQRQLRTIHTDHLPQSLALAVDVASATADRLANEAGWYWHVHDPLGLGFFGLFGPTAYCGGWYLGIIARLLGRQQFVESADTDRYLGLVADVGRLIDAMSDRLVGQALRGIVMPRPQLGQARALVAGLIDRLPCQLIPHADRYRHLASCDRFAERAGAVAYNEVGRALRDLANLLDGDYARRATETVGMAQYKGGTEIYTELVRLHTTLDLTPNDVHAIGHGRIAGIRDAMAEIRAEVGFAGDDAAYRQSIAANPYWTAGDSAGVAEHFQRSLDRIAPYLDKWLRIRPTAPHAVAPLPDALAGSMTFGYYQVPSNPGDYGTYLFNASNLTRSGLANIPALTFHELVPGHHIHLASQAENVGLPNVIKHNSFNAFNEGWAEYAATLAGEHGLYVTPEERFGRLMMDAFLTCRLVVDTGMNVLGWSLEDGQSYLRANGFMAEHEIVSESVRYACDMPGQSLAYKLGDTFLIEQRTRMQAALGDRFQLKDFHDAVLASGALPLPIVGRQIDRAIASII